MPAIRGFRSRNGTTTQGRDIPSGSRRWLVSTSPLRRRRSRAGTFERMTVQRIDLARLALPSSVRAAVHTLGVTQIVSWGTTFYAPAVFSAPIIAETGWSKTEVYGA